ncbi:MAG: oligosaccharide flippase family protein [Hyphomicrobiaceae bacterium]
MASVFFDKGIALLTIPLAAAYMAPAEFGRLDVAVSLIEIVGLVLALGHGECLLRFASTAETDADRHRVAAEFLGSAVVAAVALGLILQLAAPLLVSALSIGVDLSAMRFALAGAAVTALIDMPLMWLRLHQRAGGIFAFSVSRSLIQVATMWLVFALGYGAEGLLVGNAVIAVAIALVLSIVHARNHGIALARRGMARAMSYGSPLVISGLATFAVGSLSRWFLSGSVTDAEIAHMALAIKLGLATSLGLQPFALWWIARRMAVLMEPDGRSRSAELWGCGVAILVAGAAAVALTAPVFIHFVFPPGYHAAIALLPAAVLVCVLNELNTLTNVGSHLRTTGLSVMGVNLAGAVAAVAGYALLIPWLGVLGALVAMMLGHAVRLVLFLYDGHIVAPIPYPAGRAALFAAVAAVLVAAAPSADVVVARIVWSSAAGGLLLVLALALRLVRLPTSYQPAWLARFADVRGG